MQHLLWLPHFIETQLSFSFFLIFIYFWLRQVLVAALRLFVVTWGLLRCGTQTLSCSMHAGSSSPTRDGTRVPCIGSAESYPLDHHEKSLNTTFLTPLCYHHWAASFLKGENLYVMHMCVLKTHVAGKPPKLNKKLHLFLVLLAFQTSPKFDFHDLSWPFSSQWIIIISWPQMFSHHRCPVAVTDRHELILTSTFCLEATVLFYFDPTTYHSLWKTRGPEQLSVTWMGEFRCLFMEQCSPNQIGGDPSQLQWQH